MNIRADRKQPLRERMLLLLSEHPAGLTRDEIVALGIRSGVRRTAREEKVREPPSFEAGRFNGGRAFTFRITPAGKTEVAKLSEMELPDDWLIPELTLTDELEGTEGATYFRQHVSYERNPLLVQMKKDQAKSLTCEACGFDFSLAYGERGLGFIECHHDIPISESKPGRVTKLSELSLVCANCHRIIHRTRPWLSVAHLRALIDQHRQP